MGTPSDEAPAVGHDGAERRVQPRHGVDPGDQRGEPRGREIEEADVVFTQVDPAASGISRGRLEPGTKPAGWAGVDRKPDHPHCGLELGVVESAVAVYDHDDLAGEEVLLTQKGTDHVAGEPRPTVRQHDSRHCRRWSVLHLAGGFRPAFGTHRAFTRLG